MQSQIYIAQIEIASKESNNLNFQVKYKHIHSLTLTQILCKKIENVLKRHKNMPMLLYTLGIMNVILGLKTHLLMYALWKCTAFTGNIARQKESDDPSMTLSHLILHIISSLDQLYVMIFKIQA